MPGGALRFAGGVERNPLAGLLPRRVHTSVEQLAAGVIARPQSVLKALDEGAGLQQTPACAVPDPRSVELAVRVGAARFSRLFLCQYVHSPVFWPS
jgi:hypothetical protein